MGRDIQSVFNVGQICGIQNVHISGQDVLFSY